MHARRPSHYLAYGSNLHPLRLMRRTPSARLLGATTLSGYALRFHKRSDVDGSSKADAYHTGDPASLLHGVVYELSPGDFPVLDRIEGVGSGYRLANVQVRCDGHSLEAFLYVATESHVSPGLLPYQWYRDLVWTGAAFHGMPADYVTGIREHASMADPDPSRAGRHAELLQALRAWRPE